MDCTSPIPGKLLVNLFGQNCADVAAIAGQFDFSKIDFKNGSSEDYLHEGLMPSFGRLTKESLKQADETLKVAIVATIRSLNRIQSDQRTWDKVIEALMQNIMIEPMKEDEITRSDTLIQNELDIFQFSPPELDPHIARKLSSWFTDLISDTDVLNSTRIKTNGISKVVSHVEPNIDTAAHFFYKKQRHEKTMVDINVLRFPDLEHPYFKVYRIKLVAWAELQNVTFIRSRKSGLMGEYKCRKFKPRESVIRQMRQELVQKAAKETEDLFADRAESISPGIALPEKYAEVGAA